jgi:hypothetical protein
MDELGTGTDSVGDHIAGRIFLQKNSRPVLNYKINKKHDFTEVSFSYTLAEALCCLQRINI